VIRRLLVLALLALVLAPTPAHAFVLPPPGWVHELQSEFGWARLDAAGDDLLVARRDRIELRHVDGTVELVAGFVAPLLVAWDPSTGDALFTNADAQVRRVRGNVVTTEADFEGITGIDVANDGTIWVTADGFVRSIAPDGTVENHTDEPSYLTTIVVEPDGDVVYAGNGRLYRISDGARTVIAGSDMGCPSRADPCGDGGPATDAGVSATSLAIGDDGSIYLTEHSSSRIRVVRPDGIVHNLAGSFVECVKVERSDCIPGFGARSAIQKVVSLAFAGGDLYAVDEGALPWVRLLQVTRADQAQPVTPQGYRMIASDGGVFAFGWSPFHGSTGDLQLVSPIVAGRSNGAGGYWFVAGDGGVFTFGDAGFFGGATGATTSPVVDMAVRRDGRGYVVAERNGTVHTLGANMLLDAPDRPPYAAIVNTGADRVRLVAERPASLPSLNQPIVAAHATRSGNGIWYVASDGGVFTEGDAGFFGSTGNLRLNQPVLDLIPTPSERGYWLIAADGGVFTFGDAEFFGSMGAVRLNRPVVAGVAGPSPSG
jgi:hypothetical protein